MSPFTYRPSDEVRDLFQQTSDFAIHEMLQRILDFTEDDGTLDFNGVIEAVVPMVILKFLINCPADELNAMALELRESKKQMLKEMGKRKSP